MILVHSSKYGHVFQSDAENCFYLQFSGNEYKLNVCALIALKSKIDKINIVNLLLDHSRKSDIEIIPLCNNSRVLVLTLEEILDIKELIAGSLVMMELNSIVHHRINRIPA